MVSSLSGAYPIGLLAGAYLVKDLWFQVKVVCLLDENCIQLPR